MPVNNMNTPLGAAQVPAWLGTVFQLATDKIVRRKVAYLEFGINN